MYYPGTVIEKGERSGHEFLSNIFDVTAGLVLSQVTEITGLGAPAVQNWVNRGWLSRPVNKKYNKDQTARILIINMLRDTMSLEDISKLLFYLNGDLDDREDDIIPESELYGYICDLLESCFTVKTDISGTVSDITKGYEEKFQGAKQRLKTALMIIAYGYRACQYITMAKNLLDKAENINIHGKEKNK